MKVKHVRKPVYPSDLSDEQWRVVTAGFVRSVWSQWAYERSCALALLVGIRKSAWGRGLQTIFAIENFNQQLKNLFDALRPVSTKGRAYPERGLNHFGVNNRGGSKCLEQVQTGHIA